MDSDEPGDSDEPTRIPNRIVFASVLMVLAGLFHSLDGLVALFKPSLYQANSAHLLLLDYTQWGWTNLIIGVILISSAFSLLARHLWGRIIAIVFSTISAVINFGFIWSYPIWSIMIIILDLGIIFSVVFYQKDPLA